MKYSVPEISWHNRDPVLSVDFQPRTRRNDDSQPRRLATAGTDSHVLIWHFSISDSGAVSVEVAADLTRHQKAVNVARWSPSGEFLATGDDEAIIMLWKQRTDKDPPPIFDQVDEQDKETWIVHKILRGHMEDVLDISWDCASLRLASGSVDNKLLCWDVSKGRSTAILADHKGFVQGVAWDPHDQYIASISTDRVFRTFDVTSKKVTSRSSKSALPFPASHPLCGQTVRLYYDDTLQTYFRRLHFSPEGSLVAVPSGHIEPENGMVKPMNAVFIYTRYYLKTPACVLPCGDSPALVVRWCPLVFSLRPNGPPSALGLSHRMVLAVGTKTAVILYDTQQRTPFAYISNIHYTRLTDLTWSDDGLILVASSTDGFCSVVSFSENELGERLKEEITLLKPKSMTQVSPDSNKQGSTTPEVKNIEKNQNKSDKVEKKKVESKGKKAERIEIKGNNKLHAFMQFKVPDNTEKVKTSPKKPDTTPISIDLITETAMPSWSDDSNSAIKPTAVDQTIVIEDSNEDIKLVYQESQTGAELDSPPPKNVPKSIEEKKEKVEDVKENSAETKDNVTVTPKSALKDDKAAEPSPKTPRRVSFVTLSSPGSKKKLDKDKMPSPAKKMKTNDAPMTSPAPKTDSKVTNRSDAQSPKTPRRVNFITLPSRKDSSKN